MEWGGGGGVMKNCIVRFRDREGECEESIKDSDHWFYFRKDLLRGGRGGGVVEKKDLPNKGQGEKGAKNRSSSRIQSEDHGLSFIPKYVRKWGKTNGPECRGKRSLQASHTPKWSNISP